MKELKVGMYVRNERGIAKYLGLGKDVLTNNESNQFKHYAMQHLFDEPIFDVGHDWGDTLSEEEFKNIDKYIIGEPSESIIDLIQSGDYVNGVEVEEINDKWIMLVDNHVWIDKEAANKLIESVVTYEQFESVKYEVKKDE